MTILHLTTFLQGGAGRAIADLACAQHARGHEVTVVTSATGDSSNGNHPENLDRLRAAGVTLRMCDSLFARDLALTMRVVEMLREHVDIDRLDVAHAHAAMPALAGRLFTGHASQRIPVVQTEHGWDTHKTEAQAAADAAILRDVDHVVATSRGTRELLVGFGVPAGSVSVIPCGLPAQDEAQAPAEARRTLQPLRARGARLIGCIGSVTPERNQRLLIDALPALADLDVLAIFIGDGSEGLVPYARATGVGNRVGVCGYQPNASHWLPLLDLLVLPSRTDGQGLVALEAFRAGVPVVASDIPALAELVEDGRTGLLVDGDDATALAAAIRRALTLEERARADIIQAARNRFAADFTVDQTVARHEVLYAAVARRLRTALAA